MNNTLNQILIKLRNELPHIKNNYKVQSIEVFGSYVNDDQKKGSDLDLLVMFSENPSLLKFIELENYLSDKLGISVDLVMKDCLKPGLRTNILAQAVAV